MLLISTPVMVICFTIYVEFRVGYGFYFVTRDCGLEQYVK